MWQSRIEKIILIVCLGFVLCFFLLAIYGSIQLYERNVRKEQEQITVDQIAKLQDRIYWLQKVNAITPVLEQILTPMMLDELQLQSEQLKQRKEVAK